MKTRLLWKLLLINILVVAFVIAVVWMTVDYLAAGYFMTLMEKYHISPDSSHAMFIGAVHRYLIWASLSAVLLSILLSFYFMKRLLTPLAQMTRITRRIAAGDYTAHLHMSSRDEIGQLAEAFNRMTQSLQHIEQLRKSMVVDVAHELRTPLTNIMGYLEALEDGVVDHAPQTLELFQEETRRLVHLVEGLMQLAKADAVAGGELSLMAIDIQEVLSGALRVFQPKFDQKSIRLDVADIEATVLADPHQLSRVLDNLLQNAWHYTPGGGRVAIDVEKNNGFVKVVVQNSGVTVTPEELPLMFERFFRGEKSRSRAHGGAGIGLAIVKELVRVQGGQVGAELVDGHTVIWFTLPSGPGSAH